MNFCSNCGERLVVLVPPGDDRPRFVCNACETIHYSNPKMVVGCVPELDGRILLCRRAIEPRFGKWTLPAGYLENGETVADCAKREAYEEALARVENLKSYALLNIPFINQVYFIFRAQLANDDYQAGNESLEVKLYRTDDIPWSELAFPVIREVLKLYCGDLVTGEFPFHMVDIAPQTGMGGAHQ
ncbi:MAG: NUDIX hydrolase [Deltaproteobacteria bacterium]|nr:MAG: NUDIX hydrolase [Deltaproteobacteria bacterium]